MAHGIAEGVEPTDGELGLPTPRVRTNGQRRKPEGVLVATGQEEIRVGFQFELDPDKGECVLRFTCRFPATDNHGEDWDKAARAEMVLREVLSGLDPHGFVLRSDMPRDREEG